MATPLSSRQHPEPLPLQADHGPNPEAWAPNGRTFATPSGRRSVETTTTACGGADPTTTRVHRHYTDTSDNPGYVTQTDTEGTTSNTWYGASINGDLGITITGDTKTLSLIDPLGSIATTITHAIDQHAKNTLTLGPVPTAANTATAGRPIGYGWLGGKQRPTHASGLLLMGARLYNPVTGLFTTTDPIPGGNTTTYTYPQDPTNQQDLDGQFKFRKWFKRAVAAAGIASGVVCVVATAGACLAVGATVAAVTIGSNYYGYRKKEMSRRQFLANSILDMAGVAFSGVRAVKNGRHILGTGTWITSKASTAMRHARPSRRTTITLKNALVYRKRWSYRLGVQSFNAGRAAPGLFGR